MDANEQAYPTFRNALGLVAILLGVNMTLGVFLFLAGQTVGFLQAGLVNIISIGLPLWVASRKSGTPVETFIDPGRFPGAAVVAVLATSLGLSILLSEVDNLFQRVLPMSDAWREALEQLFFTDNVLGALLVLVVVAPLTEELLFRRIVLAGFLRNYRSGVAVLLSALLFGAVHLNPWQFLTATLSGLYLGWLYMRFRSYLLCVLGHAFQNAFPLLVVSVFQVDIPGYSAQAFTESGAPVFQPLWLDLLGLVLLAVGVLWTMEILRSAGNPDEQEPGEQLPYE